MKNGSNDKRGQQNSACKHGITLIQRRDSTSGNNYIYFYRKFKQWKNGFGVTETEMFFGLENMVGLNRMGNVVLWIEAVKQINETQLWIEFDNFKILKSA